MDICDYHLIYIALIVERFIWIFIQSSEVDAFCRLMVIVFLLKKAIEFTQAPAKPVYDQTDDAEQEIVQETPSLKNDAPYYQYSEEVLSEQYVRWINENTTNTSRAFNALVQMTGQDNFTTSEIISVLLSDEVKRPKLMIRDLALKTTKTKKRLFQYSEDGKLVWIPARREIIREICSQ